AGNSTVSLTNGSTVNGSINYTTGSLQLTSQGSTITTSDNQLLKVSNANFDSTSKTTLSINGINPTGGGTLQATRNVTFAAGATLTPQFTEVIPSSETVTLVSAGNLTLGSTVNSLVTPNTSFMNVYTANLDPNNANDILLNVHRKSASEMGLDPNMSALYN